MMLAQEVFAQPDRQVALDQLEQRFGEVTGAQLASEPAPARCLLPYRLMYEMAGDELKPSMQNRVEKVLSAPEDDRDEPDTLFSESGKFRLLYTTAGKDSVPATDDSGSGIPDYVEKAAAYADYSYQQQIEELGFVDPTIHHGANECRSGSEVWQDTVITIRFRDFGYYGSFTPNTPFEMTVHSNFDGFPRNDLDEMEKNRLGALRVTVAHEFKHVIQYATNCFQGDAGNWSWLEMDATMMENIVHPEVNDYYNYIEQNSSIFKSPHSSIPSPIVSSSYSHVTWMLFFAEYYGMDFWVDVWDRIHHYPDARFDEAMNAALLDGRGDHFESALIRNHLWHMAPARITSIISDPSVASGNPYYGFSEQHAYPGAEFFESHDTMPQELGERVEIPHMAARYYSFSADRINGVGQSAFLFFKDRLGVAVGVLAKTREGKIVEYIIPSSAANPQKYRLPFDWEELEWMGLVAVNSDRQTSTRAQLLAGAGKDIQELWWYGDVTKDGQLTEKDALFMLEKKLEPERISGFERYIGDLSGDGELTHYDAALLYRHMHYGDFTFPIDSVGRGKAPSWRGFEEIDDHEGTVFPVAKLGPGERRDTVTAELRTSNDFINAYDDEIDLTLSVPGASDSTWSSFYLELAIDYPPQDSENNTGDIVELELLNVMNHNSGEQMDGWLHEQNEHSVRLVYASSVTFGKDPLNETDTGRDDLVTLFLEAKNRGRVHFEIVDFKLDEYDYVVDYVSMEGPIDVHEPVAAEPPVMDQPMDFALHQNYPNPFNPETVISFTLPQTEHVHLQVYDITGRKVAELLDEKRLAGRHQVRFDMSSLGGLGSGVYLYRLEAGNMSKTRKMTIIK